jgi:hypothetical protein
MRFSKGGASIAVTVIFAVVATFVPLPITASWRPLAGAVGWLAVVLSCYVYLEAHVDSLARFRHRFQSNNALFMLALVFLVSGAIGTGIFLLFKAQEPSVVVTPTPKPFRSEMRCVIDYSGGGPLSFFVVGYNSMYGATISPVPLLVYMQITNLQSVPRTVVSYSVAVRDTPADTWEPLQPISLVGKQLFSLGEKQSNGVGNSITFPGGTYRLATKLEKEGLRNAVPLSPRPKMEDELTKPIQGYGTVYGWAAFESKRFGESASRKLFRVTIRDSANVTSGSESQLPTSGGDANLETQIAYLDLAGPSQDISKSYLRYANDSFPQSTPSASTSRSPTLSVQSEQSYQTQSNPGLSLHMSIRVTHLAAKRRKYLFDFGKMDAERLSIYVSSDNIFTLCFTDAKGEPHLVQVPLGENGLPVGSFQYLVCDLGVSGHSTYLGMLLNGAEIGVLKLPFKTDIGALDVPNGVIGADLLGSNGSAFDLAELQVYGRTLVGSEAKEKFEYFKNRPLDKYVQFSGEQWMRVSNGPGRDAKQGDLSKAPKFRVVKSTPSGQ